MSRLSLLLIYFTLSGTPAFASEEFLSMKFSKKNQIRTAMTWIRFKPNMVLGANISGNSYVKHAEAGRKRDAGRQALPVSAAELKSGKPYAAIGKLLYTRDDGQIASCTASFAGKTNVIMTAAHCLMSRTGDWYSNFLFIRSFGAEVQDTFAIECLATNHLWGEVADNNITRYDYAFLKTNRTYEASPLKVRAGVIPVSSDLPTLTIVGYSDNHLNGRKLLQLDVETITDAGMMGSLQNPFGSGNSGAPWLSFAGIPGIHSVSSHFKAGEQAILWGPMLSSSTLGLLEYTGNGCESG